MREAEGSHQHVEPSALYLRPHIILTAVTSPALTPLAFDKAPLILCLALVALSYRCCIDLHSSAKGIRYGPFQL